MKPGKVRRVAFFFNAQLHQALHGVSVAAALARQPGFEVDILSPSEETIAYARDLVARLGGAPVGFHHLATPFLSRINRALGRSALPKLVTLALAAPKLASYDAIALPERTSILLKRLGLRGPRYVHLDHGAGDRAAGFDPRIRFFDFVLMAGEKHRARMLRDGLVRPGLHAVVGYPKFEAAAAMRDPAWSPFADDKPVILYNPHFSGLGSWPGHGVDIVRQFAAQQRYNLIVAPHIRLFAQANAHPEARAALAELDRHEHIHVDLGSERSVDMSYTTLADVYVGDVSSQVYEFLRIPKPCLFLNPHKVDWRDDENYAHWHFGPVIDDLGDVPAAVDAAIASHGAYLPAQRAGLDATFGASEGSASERAAAAIASYLTRLDD